MNEGHSAFLQLERLRELVEDGGLSREAALERLRASTVFTTHTPVPAGNEVFDAELVERNVAALVARCGFSWDEFVALGRVEPDDTRLRTHALRAANVVVRKRRLGAPRRGVARDVARVVAGSSRSRTSRSPRSQTACMRAPGSTKALTRCSATRRTWARRTSRARTSSTARSSGARTARRRSELLRFMRARGFGGAFDPDALTIGFARRFATYKRADLIFSDLDRLARPARRHRAAAAARACREGAPGGRGRQGDDPQGRRVHARSAREGPRRLSARLRDDARALSRAGSRRLAEQSAPSARGVGDVGYEGGAERRRQHARSSTAGGARATRPRPASRSAARRSRSTRPRRMRPTLRRSSTCSSGRSCPPTTSRGAVARPDAQLDRAARCALQHEPDGRRVRREPVSPGASRSARPAPDRVGSGGAVRAGAARAADRRARGTPGARAIGDPRDRRRRRRAYDPDELLARATNGTATSALPLKTSTVGAGGVVWGARPAAPRRARGDGARPERRRLRARSRAIARSRICIARIELPTPARSSLFNGEAGLVLVVWLLEPSDELATEAARARARRTSATRRTS